MTPNLPSSDDTAAATAKDRDREEADAKAHQADVQLSAQTKEKS